MNNLKFALNFIGLCISICVFGASLALIGFAKMPDTMMFMCGFVTATSAITCFVFNSKLQTIK